MRYSGGMQINPLHAQSVERALAFLDERFETQPSLEVVARHAGVSPFHFQRIFTAWTGISPKRYLQFTTAACARAKLAAGDESVFDAALDSGLSGGGRLHDLFVAVEAMTPGEVRRGGEGLIVAWGRAATPFGECLVAQTERGVCALRFLGEAGVNAVRDEVRRAWPKAKFVRDDAAAAATAARIFTLAESDKETASGKTGAPETPLRLLLKGTNFQLKVWEALLRVPSGRVVSYEEIARHVGRPSAVRAVGTAIGDNPIAYLIPCHRVLRKNLELGGYAWGLARKRLLLAHEAERAAVK